MPLSQGKTDDGQLKPLGATYEGHGRVTDRDAAAILEELLLEMRAIRLGFELLNNLQPGELKEMVQNAR